MLFTWHFLIKTVFKNQSIVQDFNQVLKFSHKWGSNSVSAALKRITVRLSRQTLTHVSLISKIIKERFFTVALFKN